VTRSPIERAIDWFYVMENIYGSEAEADKAGQTEEIEVKAEDQA
jgi:hypothetical protein